MKISGFWGFSGTSNFAFSVSSYFWSSNPLSLSVTVADGWSNASSTITPPFSIAVDKNPFFHSINSFPGAVSFVGLCLPIRSGHFNSSVHKQ